MGEVLKDLPWIMYSQSADKIYSFWQEHNWCIINKWILHLVLCSYEVMSALLFNHLEASWSF